MDILGSLTAGLGVLKDDVGRIDILDFCSYVVLQKEALKSIRNCENKIKIKGKIYNFYEK